MDIKKAISEIEINIDGISDPVAKSVIIQSLNIIEAQAKMINDLRKDNQNLQDENNVSSPYFRVNPLYSC